MFEKRWSPVSLSSSPVVIVPMLPFRETVLLVEEDVEFARLVRQMIHDQRGEMIEVIHARTLAEAREAVSSHIPDIILTDIIPNGGQDVNAIEVLRGMAPGIPIIVLSSLEYENIAVQALKLGAQDYLYKKDVTPEILIRSIAYALERIRIQEGLLLSEERLRAQYAGIPVPTFTFRIDPEDFTLINFNHAANDIIGDTDGGNIGMSALLLFREKHEIIDLLHQCAHEQENKRRELAYPDTDTNENRLYSVSCSFLPRDLVMVCIEDITEKRTAHELLQNAHDELEEEVEQRTKELKQQNELLKKETEIRALIEQELTKTAGELRVIVEILEVLNNPLEEADAIKKILLLLKEYSGLDAVGIRLMEGEDYPLYEVIGRDSTYTKKDMSLCAKPKRGDTETSGNLVCMCGKVLSDLLDEDAPYRTKGGSFWSNEMDKLLPELKKRYPDDTYRGYCLKEGFISLALIPIRAENETIGLLQLYMKKGGAFLVKDIQFYEGIAQSIGIAFKRKMDEEKFRVLSITDRLTGLFNQHYFFEKLNEEIKRAARMSHPVSLIMLDLDNFKEYNDTHGHLEGNELLRKVGRIIRSCIKEDVDSAFRYGGDEFTVILPHADSDQANKVVKRIVKAVKSGLKTIQISGGASCTKTYKTITDLINAADLAMYDDKEQKKNKKPGTKKTSSD